uniref:DNA topoisomerase 3-alpha n=1 Tax=Myxine glutinosa TaxID=7769 RepID=UPI00358E05CE
MSARARKVLCVAEKNDAAKNIADIMSGGRFRRREGQSRFNKIYEYEHNLLGQNFTVIMTSVSGHLFNFAFKASHRKWRSCHPLDLFEAEVEKICPTDYLDIKRTLEREVSQCENLIIWTDCDREGENIGFEVIEVCKAVKPNIPVWRAKFSEITHHAVCQACERLMQPDHNVSNAVDVRQELDLRIGAAFTRFQTLRLQSIFPQSLTNQLISYGSCQFPTLGFVVERFKAIEAFVAEAFYRIKVTHNAQDETVEFVWKRKRLFHHTACLILYQICLENPTAKVLSVTSKPKSKWRPQALDTVEMEKLVSRKLKLNAKEAMKIAEKLYTQGLISYPRTETNIFPKNMELTSLVQMQTQDPNWGGFAQQILQSANGPNPRNGHKTDQAHPPIHPTKYSNSLHGNEGRLYEFIVRHFLACCSQDAEGRETTVNIEVAREGFSASGLMIIARNYLDVYPYDKWNAKVIPLYEQGQEFQPSSIEMVDGETSPPKLLTEADLISLMDKHGIGTDATHAEHIETIKARKYVGLTQDERFIPGELGMGLVEGYNSMGYEMSKPNLRAELEADLKLICEGKKDNNRVLREQVHNYRNVFLTALEQASKLDEALAQYLHEDRQQIDAQILPETAPMVRKCPHCNSDMALKRTKNGRFMISCSGYPSCKAAVWFPDGVLEVAKDEGTCDKCSPQSIHRLMFKFKRGSVPPLTPLEYIGCIGGCDDILADILDLKYLRQNMIASSTESNSVRNLTLPQQPLRYQQQDNRNFVTAPVPQHQAPRPQHQAPRPQYPAPTPQHQAPRPRYPAPRPQHPAPRPRDQAPSSTHDIHCNCNEIAILLTVRKEGANQGRKFYKCNAGGCNFFLWADEPPAPSDGWQPPAARQNVAQTTGRSAAFNTHSVPVAPLGRSAISNTLCSCNLPTVTRVVQKEGPNTGRSFHTCSKPRDQQCGFFSWADENCPAGPGSVSANPAARPVHFASGHRGGNSTRDAGGNAPRRRRTCGICRQPGHTRKTCPEANQLGV